MASGAPFPILDVLRRHEVPLVIIGGHAVAYHGYVRATEDLDIVFRRSTDSETSLFSALQELNAQWIGNEIDPTTGIERAFPITLEYVRCSHLMMLLTNQGFLDIFDYIPGFPEASVDELFDTAEQRGRHRYASLAWLRKMKSAAGRTQDQLDLERLPEDL